MNQPKTKTKKQKKPNKKIKHENQKKRKNPKKNNWSDEHHKLPKLINPGRSLSHRAGII